MTDKKIMMSAQEALDYSNNKGLKRLQESIRAQSLDGVTELRAWDGEIMDGLYYVIHDNAALLRELGYEIKEEEFKAQYTKTSVITISWGAAMGNKWRIHKD